MSNSYKFLSKNINTVLVLIISVSFLVSIKFLINDDCYFFDSNDDANHTFVNLYSSFSILNNFELPFINLFNNFGTPIIGDALTYPFSIQSLTYIFFEDYIAMTINRLASISLTLIGLFIFFKRYLPTSFSFVSSLLVLLTPGIFWNIAHHHYQVTLLFFILILNIYFLNYTKNQFFKKIVLYFIYIFYFLSVSIQLVVFSIPFLLLFHYLNRSFLTLKLKENYILIALAFIFTLPHHLLFLYYIVDSVRLGFTPYVGYITNLRHVLMSLISPPGEWMHYSIGGHYSIATYISLPIIILYIISLVHLKNIKSQKGNLIFKLSLFLGIIPTVLAFIFQFYLYKVSIIKSIDSLRFLWFSSIFLIIPIGYFLSKNSVLSIKKYEKNILFFLLMFLICFLIFPFPVEELMNTSVIIKISIIGSLIVLTYFLFFQKNLINLNQDKTIFMQNIFLIFLLLICTVPVFTHVLNFNKYQCGQNHFYNYKNDSHFIDNEALDVMVPFSRIAAIESPYFGTDLRGIYGNLFGTGARSIIANKYLKDFLSTRNLIVDENLYYLNYPTDFSEINKLGIRYILTKARAKLFVNNNWELIYQSKFYYIYENPNKPSLVYLSNSNKYLDFNVIANGIEINLEGKFKEDEILNISLFNNGLWTAFVDDAKMDMSTSNNDMISLKIESGTKKVILKYGYNLINYFLFFMLFSMILFFCLIFKNYERSR